MRDSDLLMSLSAVSFIQALGAFSNALEVKAGVRNPAKPESAALANLAPNVSVVAADPLSPDFSSSLQVRLTAVWLQYVFEVCAH